METPSMSEILAAATEQAWSWMLFPPLFTWAGKPSSPAARGHMSGWRKGLFGLLSRNAWNITTFFGIPPNRVVELGSQVEL